MARHRPFRKIKSLPVAGHKFKVIWKDLTEYRKGKDDKEFWGWTDVDNRIIYMDEAIKDYKTAR